MFYRNVPAEGVVQTNPILIFLPGIIFLVNFFMKAADYCQLLVFDYEKIVC